MPLIDDRGRLFGKLNLIDVVAGLALLALIPLGYGAYVLFRAPAPQITALEPSTLTEGKDLRVQLRGEYLRPFLRVYFGTQIARRFLLESPNLAEVELPDLPAGTYDLVLYDGVQEVARQPNALTIMLPPPPPKGVIQVLGEFSGLDKDEAEGLSVGSRFPENEPASLIEILALKSPRPAIDSLKAGNITIPVPIEGKVKIDAILGLQCYLVNEECKVGDTLVAPGVTMSLPGSKGEVLFFVKEVRPADAPMSFALPSQVTAVQTAVQVTVQVLGVLQGLDKDEAQALSVGSRFPEDEPVPLAEVLALQSPQPDVGRVKVGSASIIATPVEGGKVRVPTILRMRCTPVLGVSKVNDASFAPGINQRCRVGDVYLGPGIRIALPRSKGKVLFVIEKVQPPDMPVAFPSEVTVQVVGAFQGLDRDEAEALSVGYRFSEDGQALLAEVLALQPPRPDVKRVKIGFENIIATPVEIGAVRMAAILSLRCRHIGGQCKVDGVVVVPGTSVALPGSKGRISFVVEEVRSPDMPVAFPSESPRVTVQVVGAFQGLDKDEAEALSVGYRFSEDGQAPLAEVLALQPPRPDVKWWRVDNVSLAIPVEGKVRMPAILRLPCVLANAECKASDTPVVPGVILPLPGPKGEIPFLMKEVRPVDTPVAFPLAVPTEIIGLTTIELLVRFVVRPEVLALVKVGDVDQWAFVAGEKWAASLVALKEKQELLGRTRVNLGIGVTEVEERLSAFAARLRVPVQKTPAGWQYKAQSMKVGEGFTFETLLYTLHGQILRIIPPQSGVG